MTRPLRVLLVEDDPNDAMLLERLLRSGGYEPEVRRVTTRRAFVEALAEPGWDVVISDYYIHGFTGEDAWDVLQRLQPNLPFVLVSGKTTFGTQGPLRVPPALDIPKGADRRLLEMLGRIVEGRAP